MDYEILNSQIISLQVELEIINNNIKMCDDNLKKFNLELDEIIKKSLKNEISMNDSRSMIEQRHKYIKEYTKNKKISTIEGSMILNEIINCIDKISLTKKFKNDDDYKDSDFFDDCYDECYDEFF